MFIKKNISLKGVIAFSGGHIIWITLWASAVTCLFEFTHWEWMSIPWLPLSLIGTAVAFYIGFKNNQSYDRLWEARKIWGAIVNSSRAWGTSVKAYLTFQFATGKFTEDELQEMKKNLIYRHLAWLYTLRSQLLIPAPWEHIEQGKHVARLAKKRMKRFGVGLTDDGDTQKTLKKYLCNDEYKEIIECKNTATQLIDKQAQELAKLRKTGIIEDFRHIDLQKILNDLYIHQGKCERIKKFPLPRQYGGMSMIFVGIFIFLLPFGMVSEFHKLGEIAAWVSIPFTVLVAWVYLVMELVGDYSENPFEGMGNDIPMLSLCRTIEIDLLEMLGEKPLPKPIAAKNGVLM